MRVPTRGRNPFHGVDPRAVAGGGILLSLGWGFLTIHTATALQSADTISKTPVAVGLSLVIPLGLAVTLFAGALCVYYYDLGELALRISLWTLFGMVAFFGVIGGALRGIGIGSVAFSVLPVILVNVAAGGAVLGLLVGLYDARQRRLHHRLVREHRRSVDFEQRLSVLSRVHRHDFRNKLNIIIGTADRLETESTDVQSRARTIRDAGEELDRVTDELRDLDRLRTSATTTRERIDLADVVDSAVASVGASFPEATIEWTRSAPLPVRASPLLPRVVEELLDNAVRHTGDAPTVDIAAVARAEGDDEWIELTIRDDGPGIPDDEIDVHEAPEETSLSHSNGLGLWLVAWIVEASDGTVDIARRETGGTAVTVRLPAAPEPA